MFNKTWFLTRFWIENLRITTLIVLEFGLIVFSAPHAQAQACGGGFSSIRVLDSEGKSNREAVIEIVSELKEKKYYEMRLDGNEVIKIPTDVAGEIIKQKLPMNLNQDFCKNPLKQVFGLTKVKISEEEASIENLGFCSLMTYGRPLLLKISAPDYLTDYYAGSYLGNCGKIYEFVLTRAEKKKGKNSRSVKYIYAIANLPNY